MSYRVVQYGLREFVLSPEDVAASLNVACQRDHRHYRVSGLCQTRDEVIFLLEDDPEQRRWEYVLAAFPGESAEEVAGEIQSRWQGQFSTRGLVRLTDQFLGLFERVPAAR